MCHCTMSDLLFLHHFAPYCSPIVSYIATVKHPFERHFQQNITHESVFMKCSSKSQILGDITSVFKDLNVNAKMKMAKWQVWTLESKIVNDTFYFRHLDCFIYHSTIKMVNSEIYVATFVKIKYIINYFVFQNANWTF